MGKGKKLGVLGQSASIKEWWVTELKVYWDQIIENLTCPKLLRICFATGLTEIVGTDN